MELVEYFMVMELYGRVFGKMEIKNKEHLYIEVVLLKKDLTHMKLEVDP